MGIKVAVYGTLRKNGGNHRLLDDSTLLGEDRLHGWNMHHLGGFPGLKPRAASYGAAVVVEVYEVNEETFRRLDRLEGYSEDNPTHGLYNRSEVMTKFGKAWVYVYNGNVTSKSIITSGDWFNIRRQA